jgi:uncharacterized protein YjiS (DUF1127 family)
MSMSLVNFFVAAGRAIADWHRRQHAYEELMALDDHCLADLGIQRSEINAYLAADRHASAPAVSATRQAAIFGKHKAA